MKANPSVLVTGLSQREEAAFGIFLSRALPEWSWDSALPDRHTAPATSDLLVVDLVPLGLGQWSQAAQTELIAFLQGTPAVLLVPSHDRSWAALDTATARQHSLVWLTKPYGTKDMRAALDQAASYLRPKTAPVAVAPEPAIPPIPLPEPEPAPPGLSPAQLQARLAQLPVGTPRAFLHALATMLAQGLPFEARFTVQNSLIVHPADGWAATNTPLMVIERVCQSDALASAVELRQIDSDQAEERVTRLRMPPTELDAFLFALVAATLDKTPPAHATIGHHPPGRVFP